MSRISPYSGIIWAVLLFLFLWAFSSDTSRSVVNPAPAAGIATSSPAGQFTLPSLITAPSVPSASATTAQKKPPPSPAATTSTAPPPSPQPQATNPLTASAEKLRTALVNIICYVEQKSGLRSISGSGVLIDERGIIITNAHVAQFLLLADRGVSCTIRLGAPAIDRYRAALIYIPVSWLLSNANVLTESAPSGTGEHDYAFLAVTVSANGATTLPRAFPFVPLAAQPPRAGAPVAVASYGAQYLALSQIQSALFPTVVLDSVRELLTFGVDSPDVISLGGSAAAQEGSSGGGVVDGRGQLIGVLTTSTMSADTSARILHAITASYIRADYEHETGESLDTLLSGSPTESATRFAPQLPALESILTAQLP